MGALAVLERALAFVIAGPCVFAGTVTYNVTTPAVPLGTQLTVQLPQFDRALGRLQNVQLSANVYLSGTLQIENTGTSPIPATPGFTCTIWYAQALPSGSVAGVTGLSQPLGWNDTGICIPPLAAFDGVIDHGGQSGATIAFGPIYAGGAANGPNGSGTTWPVALDAFTGYGTTSFTVQAALMPPQLPPAHIVLSTNGSFQVLVTYTYSSYPASFCHGSDGWNPSACPCGSSSFPGCPNSQSPNGAGLAFAGSPSVAADSFVLTASGLPPGTACLFVQGSSSTYAGSLFGDGLLCVAGNVARLGIRFAPAGSVSMPSGSDLPLSFAGQIPGPGAYSSYQVWYRDSAAFCTPATFNLSSGVVTTWTP